MKSKILIFLFLFTPLAFLNAADLAIPGTPYSLEIDYPKIPGAESPSEFIPKIGNDPNYPKEAVLALYVQYVYRLALYLSGIIILGSAVYSGINYLLSSGNTAKMLAARQRIFDALSGMVLLFSSFLILKTINPDLLLLSAEIIPVETCDCSQTDLSSYCQKYCETLKPVTPAEEDTLTFFQVPTGRLIEDAYINKEGLEKLKKIQEAAENTRKAALVLKEKTEELKKITEECRCGKSECSSTSPCSGTSCPEKECDTLAIWRKTNEVNEAIATLEATKAQREAARKLLLDNYLQFKKAAFLSSVPGLMDYNSYLTYLYEIGDSLKTKVIPSDEEPSTDFPGWENNLTEISGREVIDPMTFFFDASGNQDYIDEAKTLDYYPSCPEE